LKPHSEGRESEGDGYPGGHKYQDYLQLAEDIVHGYQWFSQIGRKPGRQKVLTWKAGDVLAQRKHFESERTLTAEFMNFDERFIGFAHSLTKSFKSLFVAWVNAFIAVCHEKGPLLSCK
jgi:hypothetical protein